MSNEPAVTIDDVRAVSPALAHYTKSAIIDGVWRRPGLSPRDRSIVTVAALIAGEHRTGYTHYFKTALASGVTPAELSEIVLQVAFYAGWAAAFSAVPVLARMFEDRGIDADQLPPILPEPLPTGQAQPGANAGAPLLHQDVDGIAPALSASTETLLYGEVWRRPGLRPRDRDLATLASLIGAKQIEFLPRYLRKAASNGIEAAQVGEVINHLAFYVGWAAAFSAATVAREVYGA